MIRRGGCSDVAAALRALHPKPNSTDPFYPILSTTGDRRRVSQYDTTAIDRDREQVGYHISAGNGDGEKVNKLAAKKSSALTSMPSAYSGVAGRAGSGAG